MSYNWSLNIYVYIDRQVVAAFKNKHYYVALNKAPRAETKLELGSH